MAFDGQAYNDPAGGSPSTVGTQLTTHYYEKQALIELKKVQFFSQLADVTSMPKNMGKKIKRFHYLPLLDLCPRLLHGNVHGRYLRPSTSAQRKQNGDSG